MDWKVHSFGIHDHFLQLATYAIVLHRIKPHSDFPQGPPRWPAHEIQLKEAQLLTNQLRDYPMNATDIETVDAYIAQSITEMVCAVDGRSLEDLSADDFEATQNPEDCATCPYKKICWEGRSMITLHTNIFEIKNLGDLTSDYRLYRIKGLRPEHPQYHQNRQTLIKLLSFQLKSPVTVILRNDEPLLVAKADLPSPPEWCDLVRTPIKLEALPGVLTLNYCQRSAETDPIALRFLQFLVQVPLRSNVQLWLPKAGAAFFEKTPEYESKRVSLYRGFLVRATLTPGGGMGFFVDVRHRYVARYPLSARLNRQDFLHRFKARNFVYHYGHKWYDVQLTDLSDFDSQDPTIAVEGGGKTSLIEWVQDRCTKPLPKELAQMPKNAAAVHYFTNSSEVRAAPSPLCYQVLDTQHPWVQSEHSRCIPGPHIRLGMAEEFVRKYLQKLRFGKTELRVTTVPLEAPLQHFDLPDYEFGSKRILSVRNTPGAQRTCLEDVGRERAALLSDRNVGFYRQRPLDRQYFFMPISVYDSWGPRFISDLRQRVDRLFPQRHSYDPKVIAYDDRRGAHVY